MCRHLAYLGPPVPLRTVLSDPPHGLTEQAWRPRRQTHGTMNVDGFGVGWYAPDDPVPARHRGAGPVWADPTFAELGRSVRSGAFLAAVRSATAGMPPGVAAAAPFRGGRWLFSHNGALPGFPAGAAGLAASLPVERLLALDAPTDSCLLWALTLDRLERGAPPAEAVAEVVHEAAKVSGARLNLLLTDGRSIAASAAGASLSWRAGADHVVVASEPYDDDPTWQDATDGCVLAADLDHGVETTPL
ncbi:ergothioneine biosynthesis protein EgtC [Spongisporangium articulatum]|uniref:Gamma-glutamyl-hercynylcysteine sulfoxide hydrolase n=1 Tax=Spongisporangium articulatum TaxID=3362603 RepID=A0ABW8AJP6_9ACTN